MSSRINLTSRVIQRSRLQAVVCRASSWSSNTGRAAAMATATLLMASSPVWAVSSTIAPSNPSITYEQELQEAILKRSGRTEVLPELTDIPNEKAIKSATERAFIEEVASESAQPKKSEGIKETDIKAKATGPSASVKRAAPSGEAPEGGNNNALIIGALAVAGVGAAIALSGGNTSPAAEAPASTPASPSTPSDSNSPPTA